MHSTAFVIAHETYDVEGTKRQMTLVTFRCRCADPQRKFAMLIDQSAELLHYNFHLGT